MRWSAVGVCPALLTLTDTRSRPIVVAAFLLLLLCVLLFSESLVSLTAKEVALVSLRVYVIVKRAQPELKVSASAALEIYIIH